MKVSACGFCVVIVLALVSMATGQAEEKKIVQATTILLLDADTKGISKGINQIEFLEEKKPGKVRLANAVVEPPPMGWDDHFKRVLGGMEITDPQREWVRKSVKITLGDDTVVETQLLSLRDTGGTTIKLKRLKFDRDKGKADAPTIPYDITDRPKLTSDKGKRTWYVFMVVYEETLVIPKRKKP